MSFLACSVSDLFTGYQFLFVWKFNVFQVSSVLLI